MGLDKINVKKILAEDRSNTRENNRWGGGQTGQRWGRPSEAQANIPPGQITGSGTSRPT